MNILLCTQKFQDARRVLLDVLKDHNCIECAPAEIFEHLPSADVVIPFATPFGPREIEAGRFGLLQQFGVGIERIDVGAATEAGVWVCNVPGALFGNADSVAEHAIMLMLALSRRLNFVRQDIRERRVNEPAGFALLHKTCCLVGLGRYRRRDGAAAAAFRHAPHRRPPPAAPACLRRPALRRDLRHRRVAESRGRRGLRRPDAAPNSGDAPHRQRRGLSRG